MTVIEPFAAAILTAVRHTVRFRLVLSGIAQIVLVIVGVAYLFFGALRDNPFADQIRITVHLAESGGLLARQDVTLRGVPIGRVESVEFTADGVQAVARVGADARIPRDGTAVRVSGLSPAGEQYLNFEPTTLEGPYLSDGAVIGRDEASTPVPIWKLLGNIDGLLAQTDPQQLRTMIDELGVGPDGPRKLRDLLGGGQVLLSTLDGVLPETMTLLRGSRPVFQIFDDAAVGMSAIADNFGATLSGVSAKDAGLRRMLDQTPDALDTVDALLAENSPTIVQLLGNLTTVAQLSYVRVPALQQMFTDDRKPLLDSVTSFMHDGAAWAIASIYPRYVCDYPHPRDVPFIPNYPEPFMYTYCLNDDPGVLIRGARNAPRPPGDDTADPPPDWDPLRRTDPTPVGPHTIPLPYGGPEMPPGSEPQREGKPWF
ncbi:hypothetical protein BHQ15_02875 [Mycolicibacillus koreensis]|nr:hypothetical protein BHQ15_02875 [Mycolicibacillus koreensis]